MSPCNFPVPKPLRPLLIALAWVIAIAQVLWERLLWPALAVAFPAIAPTRPRPSPRPQPTPEPIPAAVPIAAPRRGRPPKAAGSPSRRSSGFKSTTTKSPTH